MLADSTTYSCEAGNQTVSYWGLRHAGGGAQMASVPLTLKTPQRPPEAQAHRDDCSQVLSSSLPHPVRRGLGTE